MLGGARFGWSGSMYGKGITIGAGCFLDRCGTTNIGLRATSKLQIGSKLLVVFMRYVELPITQNACCGMNCC